MYTMCLFNGRRKAEGGFVLIAAIMAVMILVAVGFFALTVSTQDMRISSRLVGERKAFSAAEAGVHELTRQLNPAIPAVIADTQIDSVNDPSTWFSAALPVRNNDIPQLPLPGYDLSKAYVGAVFDTVVTGWDTNYNSEASIAVGTVFAPNPSDTTYDP